MVCLFKLVQDMCCFIEDMCCFTDLYAPVTESAKEESRQIEPVLRLAKNYVRLEFPKLPPVISPWSCALEKFTK